MTDLTTDAVLDETFLIDGDDDTPGTDIEIAEEFVAAPAPHGVQRITLDDDDEEEQRFVVALAGRDFVLTTPTSQATIRLSAAVSRIDAQRAMAKKAGKKFNEQAAAVAQHDAMVAWALSFFGDEAPEVQRLLDENRLDSGKLLKLANKVMDQVSGNPTTSASA